MAETLRNMVKGQNLLLLTLVVVIGVMLSSLVPPFQSPDEFDHIKRAYLLTRGQILLETPAGLPSGGKVDTGLVAYFDAYAHIPFKPDKRLSKEESLAVAKVKWTGNEIYTPASGTGYYFPLVYAPQAVGLWVGKQLGATVRDSYLLARLLVLATSVAVLALAFRIFTVNAFVLGVLIIPMSLFQLVSASLDAFTIALTVLCVSLFMRGSLRDYSFPAWMSYALAGTILLLVNSRMNLLPLLVLPFFVWWVRREQKLLWQCLAVSVFSLAWLLVSIKATHVSRATGGVSTTQIIAHYLGHPADLLGALSNTLADRPHADFYRKSFIGILGWLDTLFSDIFYNAATGILILLMAFSLSWKNLRQEWLPRSVLAFSALLSTLLIFLALLFTWNPVPAKLIEGVQGRYFITSCIILGYALNGATGFSEGYRKKLAVVLLAVLGGWVAFAMPKLLIDRYYLAVDQAIPTQHSVQPSVPLAKDKAIELRILPAQRQEKANLRRIGVMFGTFIRQNPGEAELRLRGPEGEVISRRFSLPELTDNAYRFFELDSRPYVSGEIVSVSGVGIIAWESREPGGSAATCIVYEYDSGRRRFTPGCPLP